MLAISMLRPEQIKSIDDQLKQLEALNVSLEQKKAVKERWEKLKSPPVPGRPIRLRKHRNIRISTDGWPGGNWFSVAGGSIGC